MIEQISKLSVLARRQTRHAVTAAVAAVMFLFPASLFCQATGKTPQAVPQAPPDAKRLTAYVRVAGTRLLLHLVGVDDNNLYHSVKYQTEKIPLEEIESAVFITDYDPYMTLTLETQKEYSKAASEVIIALAPALKYITVPYNNVVDPLSDAAFLYVKAATALNDKHSPAYNKEKAQEEYAKAYRVFDRITTAKWYYGALLAELNAIYCNVKMNKLDEAAKQFEAIDEPDFGDAAFGLYWLIDAYLKFNSNQFSQALDSLIKSIVFETKDINTFPEALLLSAFCYEDSLDNYRARDLYYEVGRLFRGMPEAEIALSSLQFIRNRKLTEEDEKAAIERVFFDTVEDVNKKVDDFITETLEKKKVDKEKAMEKVNQLQNQQ